MNRLESNNKIENSENSFFHLKSEKTANFGKPKDEQKQLSDSESESLDRIESESEDAESPKVKAITTTEQEEPISLSILQNHPLSENKQSGHKNKDEVDEATATIQQNVRTVT